MRFSIRLLYVSKLLVHTFARPLEANERVFIIPGETIIGLNIEALIEECFARCRTWDPLASSLHVVEVELAKFALVVPRSIKLYIMLFRCRRFKWPPHMSH